MNRNSPRRALESRAAMPRGHRLRAHRERGQGLLRPHHRSRSKAPGRSSRPRPRCRHRKARPLRSPHPRRSCLRHQGSGRNERPLRAHLRALRTALDAHHRQPALRRIGPHLPGPGGFTSGRHFAAWLGLTPKPHSSGGKERLGGISKMGNPTLRSLLFVGDSQADCRAAGPVRQCAKSASA